MAHDRVTRTAERKVDGVSAEHDGSQPDLYGMLGVDREASREEIARAWRRRARAEHPDSRPGAAAAARFSALAEAYRVCVIRQGALPTTARPGTSDVPARRSPTACRVGRGSCGGRISGAMTR